MGQKLRLEENWISRGAVFEKRDGWDLPVHFGNPEEEYAHAKEGAVLFDLSWRTLVKVSGADRMDVLQRLLSNDMRSLESGQECCTAFLTAQAKVIFDAWVSIREDHVLLDADMNMAGRVMENLDKFIITENVTLEDVTRDYVHLCLTGQSAEKIVSSISAGHAAKRSWNGKLWLHWIVPAGEGPALADCLLQEKGVRCAGYEVFENLRIAGGIPRYGREITEEVTLPETGLDSIAASETKGCYPGQEVVARTNTYQGHAKKLRRLLINSEKGPAPGTRLYSGEKEIGWITSCSTQREAEGYAALGYLQTTHCPEHKKSAQFPEPVLVLCLKTELSDSLLTRGV